MIELNLISSRQIDEVLSLWSSDLTFDVEGYNRLASQPIPQNPFIHWLSHKNNESRPIRSILSIVRDRYKGFGIQEDPYLDLEFWDSYIGFYGTSFSSKKRDCTRFHFFKGDESKGQEAICLLQRGGGSKEIEALGLVYLGYSVFRPIQSNVVGRTAILFDELSSGESLGRPILKAKQKCSASLLNARFSIETPEFIQQDPQLGQCATASLWVASNIAAARFGSRQVKFPSITKNAVGQKLPNISVAYAAVDPNSGLSPTEIKNALAASGMMYHVATHKADGSIGSNLETCVRLSHFVYSYVESGLPVILCLDDSSHPVGHAVAAVGHFLPSAIDKNKVITLDKATANPAHRRHALVSSLIDLYYVHDDCYGPFNHLKLEIQEDVSTNNCFCQRFNLKNNHPLPSVHPGLKAKLGRRENNEYKVKEAIVPTHFRIRHDSWDSLLVAIEEFECWIDSGGGDLSIYLWRTFLTSGSEFKRSLNKRGYSSAFLEFYANLHMPKYVWVHEFTETTKTDIDECFPGDGKSRTVDGEIIIDATSPKNGIQIISSRIGMKIWSHDSEPKDDLAAYPFPCFEHKYLED